MPQNKISYQISKATGELQQSKNQGDYNNQKIQRGFQQLKKPGGRNETEKMIFFMFHETWGIEIH